MKRIIIILSLLLPVAVFAQFPANPGKQKLGVQTSALGLVSYSDTIPEHTPNNWLHDAELHIDTTNDLTWKWTGYNWRLLDEVRRVSPPPATVSQGGNTLDYRYATWWRDTDSTYFRFNWLGSCWQPLTTYRGDTIPDDIAALGSSAAVCFTYSDWYNTSNDSLYFYVDGSWMSAGTGSGGGGSGNTNLSYTASPTDGSVNSDTGTDATIPAGSTSNASLMLPGDKAKLDGIETGATANPEGTEVSISPIATLPATTNAQNGFEEVGANINALDAIVAGKVDTAYLESAADSSWVSLVVQIGASTYRDTFFVAASGGGGSSLWTADGSDIYYDTGNVQPGQNIEWRNAFVEHRLTGKTVVASNGEDLPSGYLLFSIPDTSAAGNKGGDVSFIAPSNQSNTEMSTGNLFFVTGEVRNSPGKSGDITFRTGASTSNALVGSIYLQTGGRSASTGAGGDIVLQTLHDLDGTTNGSTGEILITTSSPYASGSNRTGSGPIRIIGGNRANNTTSQLTDNVGNIYVRAGFDSLNTRHNGRIQFYGYNESNTLIEGLGIYFDDRPGVWGPSVNSEFLPLGILTDRENVSYAFTLGDNSNDGAALRMFPTTTTPVINTGVATVNPTKGWLFASADGSELLRPALVQDTDPSDGQVPAWSTANGRYEPTTALTATGLTQGYVPVMGASSLEDSNIYVDSGNVGIGTAAPTAKLHTDGSVRVTGAFQDSSGDAGTSAQVLSSTVTGTNWIDQPAGGIFNSANDNTTIGSAMDVLLDPGEYISFEDNTTGEYLRISGSGGGVEINSSNLNLANGTDLTVDGTSTFQNVDIEGSISLDGIEGTQGQVLSYGSVSPEWIDLSDDGYTLNANASVSADALHDFQTFSATPAASADYTLTLPTPVANLVGKQITVYSADTSGTYDLFVTAGTTNIRDQASTVTNYQLGNGEANTFACMRTGSATYKWVVIAKR